MKIQNVKSVTIPVYSFNVPLITVCFSQMFPRPSLLCMYLLDKLICYLMEARLKPFELVLNTL